MEDFKKASVWPTAFKWSIILSVISIALQYVFSLDNDMSSLEAIKSSTKWYEQLLGYLIPIVIIFLAIREHKEKDNQGYLKFGWGLGTSAAIGLISGVIISIFLYLTIFAETEVLISELMDQEFAKQGLEGEEADKARNIALMFSSKEAMAIFSLIGNVFISMVVGVVASLIMRKNPETV